MPVTRSHALCWLCVRFPLQGHVTIAGEGRENLGVGLGETETVRNYPDCPYT